MISLKILYRAWGVQLWLKDEDVVEIWNGLGDEPFFTVTGLFIRTLILHHLDGLTMQAVMRGAIDAGAIGKFLDATPDPHPVSEDQRGQLRARRKSRRKA